MNDVKLASVTKLRVLPKPGNTSNPTTISLLEELLRRAKAGEFQTFVMITDDGKGDVGLAQAGYVSAPNASFLMNVWQRDKEINVLQAMEEMEDVPEHDPQPTG